MSLRKIFLLICLMCFSHIAFCNNKDSLLFAQKNRLLIYPANLLLGELSLGYEYQYAQGKSLVLDATYGYYSKLLFNLYWPNDQRYAIRLSNKFIIHTNYKKRKRLFLSPSIEYIYSDYNKKQIPQIMDVMFTEAPDPYYLQSQTTKSIAFNIVYGGEHILFKHFVWQYFVGGGIRLDNIHTINYELVGNTYKASTITFPQHIHKKETGLSILMGLNFFLPLKRN